MFHPQLDNLKDEKISGFETVSVAQSQNLLLKVFFHSFKGKQFF
jgi:hypothetical protein